MDHFRKNWPSATIPPKLHMLEDHAVEFIEKWGTAFGIYGEQGAETLHNEFNKLGRIYCAMKPGTRRLDSMMKEHYRRVHPDALSLVPKCKKRSKKEN